MKAEKFKKLIQEHGVYSLKKFFGDSEQILIQTISCQIYDQVHALDNRQRDRRRTRLIPQACLQPDTLL